MNSKKINYFEDEDDDLFNDVFSFKKTVIQNQKSETKKEEPQKVENREGGPLKMVGESEQKSPLFEHFLSLQENKKKEEKIVEKKEEKLDTPNLQNKEPPSPEEKITPKNKIESSEEKNVEEEQMKEAKIMERLKQDEETIRKLLGKLDKELLLV